MRCARMQISGVRRTGRQGLSSGHGRRGALVSKLKASKPRLGGLAPRVRSAPKVAEDFYQSREWRALRARRTRDGDYFGALVRAKKDGSNGRVILDHVVERRDGGADLDPANTKWLTFNEHQAKTAKAKAARALAR